MKLFLRIFAVPFTLITIATFAALCSILSKYPEPTDFWVLILFVMLHILAWLVLCAASIAFVWAVYFTITGKFKI
jgi:hypothetical protein